MTERMSLTEARDYFAAQDAPDKRRVRGTKRVTLQGLKFDSIRERDQWLLLRDRQKRGEIL